MHIISRVIPSKKRQTPSMDEFTFDFVPHREPLLWTISLISKAGKFRTLSLSITNIVYSVFVFLNNAAKDGPEVQNLQETEYYLLTGLSKFRLERQQIKTRYQYLSILFCITFIHLFSTVQCTNIQGNTVFFTLYKS